MRIRAVRPWLILLLLSCFASAIAADRPGPRERAAQRLEEVQRHAGEPVEDFHFWQIQGWENLGPLHAMVWTRLDEAWLLVLQHPCAGLEFANGIGLTSTANRVHRRFDAVVFEQQRCRILEIRPVDGSALKAERRATRAAGRD